MNKSFKKSILVGAKSQESFQRKKTDKDKSTGFNKIEFSSNENVPWTFRMRKGKIVEDSDIGPTNSALRFESLREIIVDSFFLNLTSVTSLFLLLALVIYQFQDQEKFRNFSILYYLFALLATFIVEVAVEFILHRKVGREKAKLTKAKYLRFEINNGKFVKSELQELMIGDLVLVKKNYISPADILVFMSGGGSNNSGIKEFKVSEENLGVFNPFKHKQAFGSFQRLAGNSDLSWFDRIQRLTPQLSGLIKYKSPNADKEGSSSTAKSGGSDEYGEVLGTFKFRNDPKAELIFDKNMLFFGSKLVSSWVFGVVLYNGMNSTVLRKANNVMGMKSRFFKKRGKFRFYNNIMAITQIVIYTAQSVFTILSFNVEQRSYAALEKFTENQILLYQKALYIALQIIAFLGLFSSLTYHLTSLIYIRKLENKYLKIKYQEGEFFKNKKNEEISGQTQETKADNPDPRQQSRLRLPYKQDRDVSPSLKSFTLNVKRRKSVKLASKDLEKEALKNQGSSFRNIMDKSDEFGSNNRIEKGDQDEEKEASEFNSDPMLAPLPVDSPKKLKEKSPPSPTKRPRVKLDQSSKSSLLQTQQELPKNKTPSEESGVMVLNPRSMFDLGTVTEIVFGKLGVLTTGEKKVGGLTTPESTFRVEIERVREFEREAAVNPDRFKKKSNDKEDSFEERSNYSEKSQEYQNELNGEFLSKVFEEDSHDLSDVLNTIKKDDILVIKRGLDSPIMRRKVQPEVVEAQQRRYGRTPRKKYETSNFLSISSIQNKDEDSSEESNKTKKKKKDLNFLDEIDSLEKTFKHKIRAINSVQIGAPMPRVVRRSRRGSGTFSAATFNLDDTFTGSPREDKRAKIMSQASKFEKAIKLIYEIKENRIDINDLFQAVYLCHEKFTPSGDTSSLRDNQNDKIDRSIFNFLSAFGYHVDVEYTSDDKTFYKRYKIRLPESQKFFNILGINSYNNRERMSIIVNDPEKGKFNFTLYARGNLESMAEAINFTAEDLIAYRQVSSSYKAQGLTPIVYAKKTLNSKQVIKYMSYNDEASARGSSCIRRVNKTPGVRPTIYKDNTKILESEMQFVGCIGLQETVKKDSKDFITSVQRSGVKINVLTNLKLSQVLDICKRLKIVDLDTNSTAFMLKSGERAELTSKIDGILTKLYEEIKDQKVNEIEELLLEEEARKQANSKDQSLQYKLEELKKSESNRGGKIAQSLKQRNFNKPRALIINGAAFKVIASDEVLLTSFRFMLQFCSTLIGYRVEPSFKAQIVNLLQMKYSSKKSILAIGDSFNDISMVKTADIGIQIKKKDMNFCYGDIVVSSLSHLEKLIYRDGKNFMVKQLTGLLLLTWVSFSLGSVTVMTIKNRFEFGLFNLFHVGYYQATLLYLAASEIYLEGAGSDDPITSRFYKVLWAEKDVFVKFLIRIAPVLLIFSTLQSFFIDSDFKFVVSKALSIEGYESDLYIIKTAVFVLYLTMSCFRVAFFKSGPNLGWVYYKVAGVVLLLVILGSISELVLADYINSVMPISVIISRSNIYIPFSTTALAMLLADYLVVSFIKVELIHPIKNKIARLAESKKYENFGSIEKEASIENKRASKNMNQDNFERARSLLKDSKLLPASLKQFFNLNLNTSAVGINPYTCEILNHSQLRLFKIFSKKKALEEYKQLLKLALVGLCMKIVPILLYENRIDLLLKTSGVYNLVIYGTSYVFVLRKEHVRKSGRQRINQGVIMSSIETQDLLFYALVCSVMLELVLSIFFDTEQFEDNVAVTSFITFKVLMAPINLDYVKVVVLTPLLFLSHCIRFYNLGRVINFYTFEYKARLVVVIFFTLIGWLIMKYKHQYLIKAQFLGSLRIKTEIEVSSEKISILLPSFVVDRMDSYEITRKKKRPFKRTLQS